MVVSNSRCCNSLLQPQPMSFEPVEIKSDSYLPLKVTCRVQESVLAEEATAEPITFSPADIVGDKTGHLQDISFGLAS